MRLIHISDPHLTTAEHSLTGRSHWGKRYLGRGSWRRRRRFKHRVRWLGQLVAAVKAAAPDQILLTGDLVHIGLPEEIEEAGHWLPSLGTPEQVTVVPGNHDVYAADSWAAIREHWGPYLHTAADYPILREFPEVDLFGVSTALPTRPASACGLVGAGQLEKLSQSLAKPRLRPRVLALHHPPLAGMISFRKRLRDARSLERCLRGRGLDLILHGHGHQNRAQLWQGTRIYGVGSASYEQASFRVLDIVNDGEECWIDMVLNVRHELGFVEAERDRWQVAG